MLDTLYRFRISDEELEKSMNEIISNADLNELLLGGAVLGPRPKVGDFVTGKVSLIRSDDIYVDIGCKEEAYLPYYEDGCSNDDLDIGDETTFLVKEIEKEDDHGSSLIKLTRKNVEYSLRQKRIIQQLRVGDRLLGKLTQHSKNGWVVDADGLHAFLPANQEYLVIPKEGPEALLGTQVEMEIESLGDSVVLTRKPFAPEIKKVNKNNFLTSLNVGDIVIGNVKNITDFGVFVQVAPSIIGLCHTQDVGSAMPAVGDQIKCRVIKIDREKNRVSLGIKQVTEPTWEEIVSKYSIDDKVLVSVKSIVPYGAFVEVEPGICGLIHVSDLSWSDHIKHPKEVLKEGEKVVVVILNIDPKKKHLSMGLKQVNPDPWENVEDKYFVGQRVVGNVTNKHKFGIFIELEKGLEGLAHHTISSKSLKLGDSVEVSILRVDASKKKISLAID